MDYRAILFYFLDFEHNEEYISFIMVYICFYVPVNNNDPIPTIKFLGMCFELNFV